MRPILKWVGNRIKFDMKSKLITSGYGIEVKVENGEIKENYPILLQRMAIELGINWFNLFNR
ncbi:MAG: hypothetical protein ABWJ98_01615 [Hydrogenothermaceae bacterium]